MQTATLFDVKKIREDFPILSRKVNGKPLVYLDNGATSQKPKVVLDAINDLYSGYNSNVHRGVHTLSQKATAAYEEARKKVQLHINASSPSEIIFTKGTTEGINLIASTYGRKYINQGDEIIITAMEHHSNIVPWQMLCDEKKAKLKVIPFDDNGDLLINDLDSLITDRTKLISVVHVSNALGTVNPVKEIIARAHKKNIPVLVDGAQAMPHGKVDMQELDADFYCFSAHKVFGPTGIGVLYIKESWHDKIPPYQGGGDMIKTVTLEKTVYNDSPLKYEAGTPNIEGAIAMGVALDYINEIGLENITQYESELLTYATEKLKQIKGLRVYGEAKKKASVISFLVNDIHPYDLGTILDQMGIAVRTGHHCTQPVMDRFCIPGTARASFAFYNTYEEVDALCEGIKKAIKMLS
jgi:cysteine desulfurase/selenocysteine lyase